MSVNRIRERYKVEHEAPAKARAQALAHREIHWRRVAGGDERRVRVRAHLVEQIEQGDLLGARERVAVVDRVNRHARIEREGGEAALRADVAHVPGRRLERERMQQMRAAVAGLPPDIERAVGLRVDGGTRGQRRVEPAQPRDQLRVGAGMEVVEGRWRRSAEIER